MQLTMTTAELHYLALKGLGLEARLMQREGLFKVTTPHCIHVTEQQITVVPDGVVSVFNHE